MQDSHSGMYTISSKVTRSLHERYAFPLRAFDVFEKRGVFVWMELWRRTNLIFILDFYTDQTWVEYNQALTSDMFYYVLLWTRFQYRSLFLLKG